MLARCFCNQQALQGEEDGLEASDLLLIHTFMGLAMAAGTVIVGLVVLKPSPQCLISLQYLCQVTLYGIGNPFYVNLPVERAVNKANLLD